MNMCLPSVSIGPQSRSSVLPTCVQVRETQTTVGLLLDNTGSTPKTQPVEPTCGEAEGHRAQLSIMRICPVLWILVIKTYLLKKGVFMFTLNQFTKVTKNELLDQTQLEVALIVLLHLATRGRSNTYSLKLLMNQRTNRRTDCNSGDEEGG